MWNELFEKFDCDTPHRIQAVFSSIFIIQNRMQTAGEKIQTQISMKQWLLLAMAGSCPEPRTLTNLGTLMGCSRQNVKKLASALEKQGYIRLLSGANNSVQIEFTEKAFEYAAEMNERHAQTLRLLFEDFSEEEIDQLFRLYSKLYKGLDRVENYAKELNDHEKSEEE
ncbi:MAG: MarR family transcriptional regulator [Ruminococcaceae bacterium]|nr:MarR family transcriptional regulator [Oscillospiraceae bacterium]